MVGGGAAEINTSRASMKQLNPGLPYGAITNLSGTFYGV